MRQWIYQRNSFILLSIHSVGYWAAGRIFAEYTLSTAVISFVIIVVVYYMVDQPIMARMAPGPHEKVKR